MGRPRKTIDPVQVEELASIGCSYAEIGAVVGCNSSTLVRRFAQAIKDGHDRMRASLRRAQYASAITKGNVTMQIWMGKQWLGQSDKAESLVGHKDLTFGDLPISQEFRQSAGTHKPN